MEEFIVPASPNSKINNIEQKVSTVAKQDEILAAIQAIPGGGGVQYTEGDVDASITGTAIMFEDVGNVVRVPSVANPLPIKISDGTDTADVIDSGTYAGVGAYILDGSGNPITSFGGGTQYADGAVRGTATGTLAMGDDGTNIQSIKVDSAGELQVDVLTMPTVTVSATDLDIRNLAKAQDEVYAVLKTDAGVAYDARLVTAQANSGVDIGDVTINNASGASAVNIQDGGNTITVDGTVSANATLSAETTKVIGTVRTADGSGNLLTSTTNALDINIKSGSIANTSFTVTQGTGTNLHTVVDSGTITTITNTVPTKEVRSATPAQTSPSVGVASTSILASNANRLGATIYNEGSATCYLKLGGTASLTSYSIQVASGGYYELPFGYTGAIDGITSASTAQLRVTELTT
jgi:hypothetical protein